MNLATYLESDPEISEAQLTEARLDELAANAAIDDYVGDLFGAKSRFEASITEAITARMRLISEKRAAMVSTR